MNQLESLAIAYQEGKHHILNIDEQTNIREFIKSEFKRNSSTKLFPTIEWVNFEPYATALELFEDIKYNHRMMISCLHNESPVFDEQTNLMFRALHDWHHFKLNADFSIEGEYATFEEISALTENATIKQVLYSEIVLQAASAIVNGEFLPQKLVLVEVSTLREKL